MTSLSEFEALQEKTLGEMKDALKDERLIPFIGAGFSKNITGYPGWNEFVKELGKDIRCDLSALFKNNNLEACEYFIWKKADELKEKGMLNANDNGFKEGKDKLLEFIRNMAKSNERNHNNDNEWALHDKLVSKFNYIYTTNWDNVFEQAKSDTGKKIEPFFTRTHFSNNKYGKDAIQVIKFHGHYEDIEVDSLIACQTDYNRSIIEENPFDIKFKNDLLHYNFFFIGYDFGDPNILLMINSIQQITQDIPTERQVHLFWLSTEPFDDERVYLLKKSMQIKPYHLLTAEQQRCLGHLKQQLKQKCNKCVLKEKTDGHADILFDLCKKCPEPERLSFKNKKSQFIKEQTKVFLDQI